MKDLLSVLAVALLIVTAGAQDPSSNYLLTGHSTPWSNSLAHQFFSLASQHALLENRTKSGLVKRVYEDRTFDDDLCDRDVTFIRDSIDNLEEWALECEYYIQMGDHWSLLGKNLDY